MHRLVKSGVRAEPLCLLSRTAHASFRVRFEVDEFRTVAAAQVLRGERRWSNYQGMPRDAQSWW